MTSTHSRRVLLVALVACALAASACAPSGGNERGRTAPLTVEPISPQGPTSWPFAFEWKTTAPETALCRITVFDGTERQLLQFETKGRRKDAPEDLRKLLATTRQFLWRVSVLDENGAEAAQSALAAFAVQ